MFTAIPSQDYDGGDCCECTCISNSYACGPSYNCVDPWAQCDDVTTFQNEDDVDSFSYNFDDDTSGEDINRFPTFDLLSHISIM